MTVTHYTEPKCVESWASAANAKSGGAHSEFLLNSIAGLKYGGRSLDLRGRASLEQPFAKDAAITLPGDDRDRIALVELKMGDAQRPPLLSRPNDEARSHRASEILTNKRRRDCTVDAHTHVLALFDHSSWTVYFPTVFVFHAQMSPISPFESSYQP